jgi:protein-S-isoprenylcysteine O-methyltransferase Ste14
MKNLGLAFLALVALFMGGCSIFIIGGTFYDASQNSYGATDGYGGVVLFVAGLILTVALLVALWVWRIYKRSWRKFDYLILAFAPMCAAVWSYGLFLVVLVSAVLNPPIDYWDLFIELPRYPIFGVVASYILLLIWRSYKSSIATQNESRETGKSGSMVSEEYPNHPPKDKP